MSSVRSVRECQGLNMTHSLVVVTRLDNRGGNMQSIRANILSHVYMAVFTLNKLTIRLTLTKSVDHIRTNKPILQILVELYKKVGQKVFKYFEGLGTSTRVVFVHPTSLLGHKSSQYPLLRSFEPMI